MKLDFIFTDYRSQLFIIGVNILWTKYTNQKSLENYLQIPYYLSILRPLPTFHSIVLFYIWICLAPDIRGTYGLINTLGTNYIVKLKYAQGFITGYRWTHHLPRRGYRAEDRCLNKDTQNKRYTNGVESGNTWIIVKNPTNSTQVWISILLHKWDI